MSAIKIITNTSSLVATRLWLENIKFDLPFQLSLHAESAAVKAEKQSDECVIMQSLSEGKGDFAIVEAHLLSYPLNDRLDVFALVAKELFINESEANYLTNYLVVVGLKGRNDLKRQFSRYDVRAKWGRVVLAGFGPGDYGLVTRKAENNLQNADIIFYDDLIDQEYLQKFSAEKVYVGKRKGQHKFDQNKINDLMYHAALKGKWVVRIKGGDPLIFGRGAEEYHYLKSRLIESEIIPGISSAFAAAASAVIPLTERSLSSSVALLSGHDLNKLRIPKADTLVFYMGASQQQALASKIIDEGWHENTPVGIVHNASNPEQQIYRGTLADLKEKSSNLPSPSIIIVGKTARQYQQNPDKWLYTGVSVNDWEKDENIVHTPLITLANTVINESLISKIENLNQYNRIIFKSRFSVQYFFDTLFKLGLDVRALGDIEINCLGKSTSEALKNKGLLVQPFSQEETSLAMLKKYKELGVKNEKIIIPGTDQIKSVLRDGLIAIGNQVDILQVYQKNRNHSIVKQNIEQFKGVIFTSPQEVEIFRDVYGNIPSELQIKTIGTRTRAAVTQKRSFNLVEAKS